MKICFLAPANSIHTVRWVNSMVARNHEVHLVSLHKETIHKIDQRVHVHYLPIPAPLGYYGNFLFAKRLLKNIKPDILNTHYASGYGTLSRFIDYTPTLLNVWGSDVFEFPHQSKSNYRVIVNNLLAADYIASTSIVMRDEVKKLVDIKKEISLTPFGVDTHVFKRLPSDATPNDRIKIGIVKGLKAYYGVEYLIRSIPILFSLLKDNKAESHIPKIEVEIVGHGPLYQSLKDLADSLGLSSIIDFKGEIPHHDIPKILNSFDIYCAPSIAESFGVAVLEASACGLPVIVTDVGGLPEVVREKETGFIVNAKDPKAIAEKLYQLVVDPDLRKRIGKNGEEFVRENFSWDKSVDVMEKVYKEILNQH
ncbi:glycosyltransferase [Neobacillus sp. YX16]|uniref:glycosyltransferase n=1 Tax=Neobacillus sp. YX16 TaxID=3047874 RepID=UPI0024C39472|nr:glycosyltransferase [Neobacillus sp. YX16]WHZ02378.1 glycosyltransferase [Neobacillus sp. YX16]